MEDLPDLVPSITKAAPIKREMEKIATVLHHQCNVSRGEGEYTTSTEEFPYKIYKKSFVGPQGKLKKVPAKSPIQPVEQEVRMQKILVKGLL